MNKTKMIVIGIAGIIVILLMLGYWKNQNRLALQSEENADNKIFCTTFPVFLFTRAVCKDVDRQVELLLPPDLGCPHDYALTPGDLRRLSGKNDILIKNGLQLDDVICNAALRANYSLRIVDSSYQIPDLLAEKEACTDPDHDHGGKKPAEECADISAAHGEECKHHEHDHKGINPHLFASPFQAIRMVRNIGEQLMLLDPENAAAYRQNMEAYIGELEKLCQDFIQSAGKWRKRCFAAQHDVFSYLIRDLGLEEGVLIRASAETAPSTAEIHQLIRTIQDKQINVIFTEPQYPRSLPQMIAKEAGIQSDELDPAASGPQDAVPDYYLQVMQKNLETLNRYLN